MPSGWAAGAQGASHGQRVPAGLLEGEAPQGSSPIPLCVFLLQPVLAPASA